MGLLALALTATFAASAQAQCRNVWAPSPEGGQLILICGTEAPDRAPTPPKRRGGDKPPRATKQQIAALRFRSDEAVSAEVRAAMVQRLAYGEQADAIRAQIESGDLVAQASRNLRDAYRWSPNDLADVYAQTLLQLWLIYDDSDSTSTATDRAVRADVRQRLALDRHVRGAGDAEQQEYAETMLSWTTVIAGTYQQYRAVADADGLQRWRARTRELAESSELLGIDLADVRLTRDGIVER